MTTVPFEILHQAVARARELDPDTLYEDALGAMMDRLDGSIFEHADPPDIAALIFQTGPGAPVTISIRARDPGAAPGISGLLGGGGKKHAGVARLQGSLAEARAALCEQVAAFVRANLRVRSA